jgi:hypothetical protein
VLHSPNEHNERARIVCSATAAEFHVEFVGSGPELGRLQAAAVQREPHELLAPELEGEGDKVPVAPLAWTADGQGAGEERCRDASSRVGKGLS